MKIILITTFFAQLVHSQASTCGDIKGAFESAGCCGGDTDANMTSFAVTNTADVCIRSPRAGNPFISSTYGEDALEIAFMGVESPLGMPGKANTCIGVAAGDERYMIDVGGNCGGRISDAFGSDAIAKFKGLLLTHFHSDHISDLGELRFQWFVRHDEPLPVFGPNGAATIVAGMEQMYSVDMAVRKAHHPYIANASDTADVTEFDVPIAGDMLTVIEHDIKGVPFKVKAFRAFHPPVTPNVGYRIEYGDRVVTFTGDTVYDASLIPIVQGSDVLIQDVIIPELIRGAAAVYGNNPTNDIYQDRLAPLILDVITYHADVKQVAKIASESHVPAMYLTHITPMFLIDPNVVKATLLAQLLDIDSAVAQKTKIAIEGSVLTLPLDSDETTVDPFVYTPWNPVCYTVGQSLTGLVDTFMTNFA